MAAANIMLEQIALMNTCMDRDGFTPKNEALKRGLRESRRMLAGGLACEIRCSFAVNGGAAMSRPWQSLCRQQRFCPSWSPSTPDGLIFSLEDALHLKTPWPGPGLAVPRSDVEVHFL